MSAESSEVVKVLTEQHEELKALMARVRSSSEQDRKGGFDQLRCLLAAHEAAESEVVHRVACRDLGTDDHVVTERLAEEDQAGTAVARLEQLEVTSEEFASEFATFEKAVIAHAEAEEHKELPAVAGRLDARQEHEMVAALSQVAGLASQANRSVANGDSFAEMLQASRDHFKRSSADALAATAERS